MNPRDQENPQASNLLFFPRKQFWAVNLADFELAFEGSHDNVGNNLVTCGSDIFASGKAALRHRRQYFYSTGLFVRQMTGPIVLSDTRLDNSPAERFRLFLCRRRLTQWSTHPMKSDYSPLFYLVSVVLSSYCLPVVPILKRHAERGLVIKLSPFL